MMGCRTGISVSFSIPKDTLLFVMQKNTGNLLLAAKDLGISRSQLLRQLSENGISAKRKDYSDRRGS